MSVDLKKESDTYGVQVRDFRTGVMDMTQDDFAKMVGISVSTLRSWEQGSTTVPVYFMKMLKLMAADLGQARQVMGTDIGLSGDREERSWCHIPEHLNSVDAHNMAMAIEQIQADSMMSRGMDIMDGMIRFRKHLSRLGRPYEGVTNFEILLLYHTALMEKMLNAVWGENEETENSI